MTADPPVPLTSQPLYNDPVVAYLARLSPASREQTRRHLVRLVRLASGGSTADPVGFPWHSLMPAHLGVLRGELAKNSAPSTANLGLSILRSLLEQCWMHNLISADDLARRRKALQSVEGTREQAGRLITPDELRTMFQVATPRDAACLALMAGAGLRRAEVASLRLEAYQDGAVRVIGKGNKERIVPLPSDARRAMDAWLKFRGPEPGWLIPQVNHHGGAEIEKQLDPESIWHSMQRLAKRIGLLHFSPHDFRRTYASNLLDAGVDIVTVQKLLGHSKVDTTARYDRRSMVTARTAVEVIRLPGTGDDIPEMEDGDEEG